MHHLKTYLSWLLLMGSFALVAQPEDLTISKTNQLKANVVKLEVKYEDGSTGYGFGFVTNEQDDQLFMVTAAHLTHGSYFEQEPEQITVSFSNTLEQKRARELRWFEEEDFALLQLEKPTGYQWQKEFIAYQREAHTKLRFYSDDFLIMDGGELIDVRDNRRLRFSSPVIFPGVSGSPLLTKDGIVGMVTDDSQDKSAALSVQLIRDKLQLPAGGSPYFYKSNRPNAPKPVVVEPSSPVDDFIQIRGGSFEMGDQFGDGYPDERSVHTVRISDFMMSPTEVSVADFQTFVRATGYKTAAELNGGSLVWNGSEWWLTAGVNWQCDESGKKRALNQYNYPVFHVSWYDAIAYCNWRSQQAGLQEVYRGTGAKMLADKDADGYRLPTEAEWEYAAREGGKKLRFGNSENIARASQLNFNSGQKQKKSYSEVGTYRFETVQVSSLKKNNLGLYHMSGNVWEWCWDWYGENYYGATGSHSDPKGPLVGSQRIVRGGSWNDDPFHCRTSTRNFINPEDRYSSIGFRLVRNVP